MVPKSFDSIGFEVRTQCVCPSRCGVPMTRGRIHYVGLCREKVTNPAQQMDRFQGMWKSVIAGNYFSWTLQDFLLPESEVRLPARQAEDRVSSVGPERKWVSVHQQIFEENMVAWMRALCTPWGWFAEISCVNSGYPKFNGGFCYYIPYTVYRILQYFSRAAFKIETKGWGSHVFSSMFPSCSSGLIRTGTPSGFQSRCRQGAGEVLWLSVIQATHSSRKGHRRFPWHGHSLQGRRTDSGLVTWHTTG